MKPIFVDKFICDIGNVKFNIEFKSGLVAIMGDSGKGKTLLAEYLAKWCINNGIEFSLYNYKNGNSIESAIGNLRNNIVIIDNADIILTDENRFGIALDESNQYVIMTRRLEGLMLDKNEIAFMKRSNNEFSLEYPLLGE